MTRDDWKRIGWITGVILLLPLGVAGWRWWDLEAGRREWVQYHDAALARGVGMTLRDYLPAEVAAEDNYVTGTLFERHQSKLAAGGPAPEDPLHLDRSKLAAKKNRLFERLDGAKTAMLEAGWLKTDELPPQLGRAVLSGLERFAPEFRELRAARSRPGTHFVQGTSPPPNTEFPCVPLAQSLNALWALRLEAHLAEGEPAEALEDFRDGLRLFRAIATEPTMICGLVRMANLVVLRRALDGGIAGQFWRDEDLAAIELELGKLDLAADIRFAFASERGFMNDAFEPWRLLPIAEQVKNVEAGDILNLEPRGWQLWLKRATANQWREQVVNNRLIDFRLQQFAQGMDRALEATLPAGIEEKLIQTGIWAEMSRRYVVLEMSLRETRVACALERFRLRHGSYPETLSPLVPDCIEAIPKDVIDAQPIRYRRDQPDQFVVYSIGLNAKDDGGSTKPSPNVPGTDKASDWVWGENWK
jgi:hypothetical protein